MKKLLVLIIGLVLFMPGVFAQDDASAPVEEFTPPGSGEERMMMGEGSSSEMRDEMGEHMEYMEKNMEKKKDRKWGRMYGWGHVNGGNWWWYLGGAILHIAGFLLMLYVGAYVIHRGWVCGGNVKSKKK